MGTQPFSGVFRTRDGKYIDLASGQTISSSQIRNGMSPFYGAFLDKDGKEHDIREIGFGGTGAGPALEILSGGKSLGPVSSLRFDGLPVTVEDGRAVVTLSGGEGALPPGFTARTGWTDNIVFTAGSIWGRMNGQSIGADYPAVVGMAGVLPSTDTMIPVMTGPDTNDGYHATANDPLDTGRQAWKAFDGDVLNDGGYDCYHSTGSAIDHWVQIELPAAQSADALSLVARSGRDYCPNRFSLTGSNNGMDFTEIIARSGITGWPASGEIVETFPETEPYRFWRVTGYTGTYLAFGQIKIGSKGYILHNIPPQDGMALYMVLS